MNQTVQQALQSAISQLQTGNRKGDTDAALEAGMLLGHVLKKNRAWLYAWPEHQLEDNQQLEFEILLKRRIKGEPVSYITGTREFWGLSLQVSSHTLIPRPETELLVETALACIKQDNARVLELGTGTGAIAAALASERPGWHILAIDKDPETIDIARKNFASYGLSVNSQISNWFESIKQRRFDLIIGNPPYIESNDPHLNRGDLRFEPRCALASGADGLNDIRAITQACTEFLNQDGFLMLEHGFDQAAAVRQLYDNAGLKNIQTIRDLAGHDRVTTGQLA